MTETRRILDQFAERRGERTWQTSMTQAGLDTLRKLLRKTARKNTAVACHWIRGLDHSELLWIVGDARQFNEQGAVPTNTTRGDVLRAEDENTWHSLAVIQQLAALAALMHDLGKASDAFQDRLHGRLQGKNLYRHEWTSVRMFQAFVTTCLNTRAAGQAEVGCGAPAAAQLKDDAGASPAGSALSRHADEWDLDRVWLQQLAAAVDAPDAAAWAKQWIGPALLRDGMDGKEGAALNPLHALPPLAQAVAWLILSHHRLPAVPDTAGSAKTQKVWHGRVMTELALGDLVQVLGKIDANWNEPYLGEQRREQGAALVRPYWQFRQPLPVAGAGWRKRAARLAQALLKSLAAPAHGFSSRQNTGLPCDAYVMHLARLALMLGDHYYSSLGLDSRGRVAPERQPFLQAPGEDRPYANTISRGGRTALNQTLDEHLLGVERCASQTVHALPGLTRQLAHLRHHKRLKARSDNARFRWQDKAVDCAAGLAERSAQHGAFIVNMASTGCGKTLGNARIMNALSNPQLGMRCAFAIGLRTLTLQTGRSFQRDLGLADDELAILVGGAASRELFEYYEAVAEKTGSASSKALLDEATHVVFEGNDQHPVLQYLGRDHGARKLLAAPLLVCTVDHLMPATESLRGGGQIAPMLRLMTGDLVLDEPDDFDLDDLPALARLVHWAGLLGARVLLSSATLPPALVQGLFLAYLEGRQVYQRNRGERPDELPGVACLWVDEFSQQHADCADAAGFDIQHGQFVGRRAAELTMQTAQHERRRMQVSGLPKGMRQLESQERCHVFARALLDAALALHQYHHSVDPKGKTGQARRVSFGLIRMANIGPLFDVALALFRQSVPAGMHIHLSVYHSQFPLFMRSAIEHRLDGTLDRRDETAVFDRPDIRRAIDGQAAMDQLFIVLGSPVTEVGRDHDYDWAVVEPSSMRSLIQLAGRVLRHRSQKIVKHPNVLVCQTNLKHYESKDGIAYCRPGFESLAFRLKTHDLGALLAPWLDAELQMPVDARLRILPRPVAARQVEGNLVDLEHERIAQQMLPAGIGMDARGGGEAPVRRNRLARQAAAAPVAVSRVSAPGVAHLNASSFWLDGKLSLTAAMQQAQPFRQETQQQEELVLLPTEDEDDYRLFRVVEGKQKWERGYDEWEDRNTRIEQERVTHAQISFWGDADLMAAMRAQAEDMDLPLRAFAEKFATVSLRVNRDNNQGWYWHPWLGFANKK
ncbi:type I-F CRISPR-associated helicase Cas3f [Kerstersia sp.]|uniref:type I-F CRISPR-associated helicase Cas3f n=1 Tax=Kerstersia sp. TaxID=1930783 RepID=UPI003F900333